MSVPQSAIDAVDYLISPPRSVALGPTIGMVAVAYAGESKLNPGSQGDQSTETGGVLNPHGAYGIWSLNGPLQESLRAFAEKQGIPVFSVNTQLYWLLHECASNARYAEVWKAIQTGMDYAQFIPLFVDKFEVPAHPQAEIDRSMAFAHLLNVAMASVPAPSPAPSPSQPPGITMDPALLAALAPLVEQLLVPLIPILAKGIMAHFASPAGAATLETILADALKQLQVKPAA